MDRGDEARKDLERQKKVSGVPRCRQGGARESGGMARRQGQVKPDERQLSLATSEWQQLTAISISRGLGTTWMS